MSTLPTLRSEQELHLQTAFLLTCAVDAFDPILALKEKVELHNLTEYYVYECGPCRCLLALSSNAIKFGANTVNQFQIQPTVFIAFSNGLRHAAHEVPGQMSMANFMAAQRSCGFPGAAGCHVHGHALGALESIPLGAVFSLLGQGYKLVTTGFKFGGMLAHLFATRVLLQLHQEVQLARQMGIKLTLSLGDNKVSSYAFGSPFFATSALSRALTSLDLQTNQQVNLHTFWRAGDGSPSFFTAASELYTVAAAARDAAMEYSSGAADACGGYLVADDDSLTPGSLARTPQILAVQEWCRYVGDGVDALSRCRANGPSRLLARPLDNALLARVTAPGGLLAPTPPPSTDGGDVDALTLEKLRLADGSDAPSSPKPSSASGASRTASVSVASRTASVTLGSRPPSVTALISRTSSVTGRSSGMSRRRSSEALDALAPGSANGQAGPPPGSAARTKRGASVSTDPMKSAGTRAGASASRQQASKAGAWRDGLLRLLQVMGDGLGERYAPVGQFWILGTVPTHSSQDKDKERARAAAAAAAATAAGDDAPTPVSAPVPGGSLQAIEGSKAMQSSAAWLSPGNAVAIFSRWESELEELERELMEAFPWVTFSPVVELRGVTLSRRDLLRQSASLDLGSC